MKVLSWLSFLSKSILIGLVIAACILLLIPQLRQQHSLSFDLFSQQPSTQDKLSFNQAIKLAAPAVVNIYSSSIDYRSSIIRRQQVQRVSLGSGVIMNAQGYILTCFHVINGAESINIGLQSGQVVEAQLVGYDVTTDLAVLKVPGNNLPVIPQLENPDTQVGDVALAIGNPYNLGQTITQGIVSHPGRNGLADHVEYIQTDAELNTGNSGGALIDSNGFLIGINNANFKTRDAYRRVQSVEGVNFAVPYKLAQRVMREIIANGKVTRGRLGFTGNQMIGVPGIYVDAVAEDGPAARAGLREGDVLLSVNNKRVESTNRLQDEIAEIKPGSQVTLLVARNTQQLQLTAVVEELNASAPYALD